MKNIRVFFFSENFQFFEGENFCIFEQACFRNEYVITRCVWEAGGGWGGGGGGNQC